MAVTPMPVPEDDDVVVINLDDLTLSELEEMEDHFGKGSPELMREMRSSTLRFLAFLAKRRENPAYTYEDTANLKMSQVRMGEDPPTSGSGG